MLSLSALVAVAMQDWVQAIARLHVVIKFKVRIPPLPHPVIIILSLFGQLVEAMKSAELAVKTHAIMKKLLTKLQL